jgi:hypothetical protein
VPTEDKRPSSGLLSAFREFGRSVKNTVLQPTTVPVEKLSQTAPIASAPPLEDSNAEVAPPPVGGYSLPLLIHNRSQVDVLKRYGCNIDTVLTYSMNLNTFFDRDYKLAQMHALFPEHSQMRKLGLTTQHFTAAKSKRWDIVEYSNLYNIPLKILIKAPTGFDLSPREIVKAGLKSVHLCDAQITARDLINAKADFAFWFQLGPSPQEFAQFLKGTLNELADLGFSDEQKRCMRNCGWSKHDIGQVEEFGEDAARRFWPDDV